MRQCLESRLWLSRAKEYKFQLEQTVHLTPAEKDVPKPTDVIEIQENWEGVLPATSTQMNEPRIEEVLSKRSATIHTGKPPGYFSVPLFV